MIQERSYSSAIFFGKTIFSEHLEKENMVFRTVETERERERERERVLPNLKSERRECGR